MISIKTVGMFDTSKYSEVVAREPQVPIRPSQRPFGDYCFSQDRTQVEMEGDSSVSSARVRDK
jgi:hypothetical protein